LPGNLAQKRDLYFVHAWSALTMFVRVERTRLKEKLMLIYRLLPLVVLFVFVSTFGVFAQTAQVSSGNVRFVGTTTLTGGDADEAEVGLEVAHGPDVNVRFTKPQISGTISPARVPADHVPRPSGNPIGSMSFFGFRGLTHRDQRLAPTGVSGGRNFSLEPPDQGLAVGNGFIVEAVNDAIAVFDTKGIRLSRKALSLFLNLPPSIRVISPTHLVFGPFLSDPRVYFDWDTGHFFFTVLEIDLDPNSGAFGKASSVFIAVSETNDPTGTWNIFQLDVTNDGDKILGACPCFGDQPLIGADKFGFYINTNAFSLSPFGFFRGTQLYAISKNALETGAPPSVAATRFHNLTLAESFAFSIQPATVPPNGSFDLDNGGTEFFLSSLDFTGTLDDRLAVWALTNTGSLDTTPNLSLTHRVITTQVYGQPPDAEQRPGPTPLRDALAAGSHPFGIFDNHLELVASNDDRMQQAVFADGKLWTSLNTVVKTPSGPIRTGAAFFILTPSVTGGEVDATVFNQGYVAIDSPSQNSVMYPSIGVNASGKAVIAFSVVGQDFFPSAAFATLDAKSGAGPIVISGPGAFPDDGFTGYFPFGFRVGRWGDYSAAVADESGTIWLGNEMIPNARRTVLANWGTFITKVTP